MDYFCHESAIIDDGATIGPETRVWHWVHICSGASIGARCSLGQNVFVGNRVVIGNDVKIQNNVSVYDNVILEDGVFCGPSMVFTNVYNPRARVERKSEYRDTLVREGATLGANCTVVCGVKIGAFAFVAAGAVVRKDVADFALVAGVPARQIGWMSAFGERLDLPLTGEGYADCPHSGERYALTGDCVVREVPS
ncbi:N-acetyltransferase [Henriciella barbarensis]|uniref:N-acetyltransferase n=1 Tax=Henriciella barbarensis TaxID=86342 RepID=A0A399QSC3_9PROT|nr:acyltransferase [Henriciella barbarensis]RIJ20469.1 N-acetyltransferase [Henriciella barbarensis]